MKKLGFTLAEVLITLAIVGIIAAVTIPGLSRNVSQKSIGPTLAKAVNNLNAAHQDALAKTGKTNLTALTGTNSTESNYITKILEVYLTGSAGSESVGEGENTISYPVFYGSDGISYRLQQLSPQTATGERIALADADDDCFGTDGSLKDDAAASCYENEAIQDKYYGQYWPVLIDINGLKGDGAGGTETFLVYVDAAGLVIPAGSAEAVKYGADKRTTTCSKNSTTINEYCTASVIQNGWNVTY